MRPKSNTGIRLARQRRLSEARNVLARHWRRLSRRAGITGCGVGYRQRRGKWTREIAIQVYVEQKKPPRALDRRQMLEVKIDGIPVDVIETGIYRPTSEYESIRGGIGIARGDQPTAVGTLGLVVFTPSGLPRLLTNAHVIWNRFQPRESGIEVVQVPMGGQRRRVIGHTLATKIFRDTLVDCALTTVLPHLKVDSGLPGVAPPLRLGGLEPADVLRRVMVRKSGRSTGVTTGRIVTVDATLKDREDRHTFRYQIGIDGIGGDFNASGDSGAIVVRGREIVGLLHGKLDNGLAIACHARDVVRKLPFQLERAGENE